jgi:hypothetical protein
LTEHPSLEQPKTKQEPLPLLEVIPLDLEEIRHKIASIRIIQEQNQLKLTEIGRDLEGLEAKEEEFLDLMIQYLKRKV